MTKHIAGLILFSFIVGVSVLFSATVRTFVPATIVSEADVPVSETRDNGLMKKKKRKRHHCRPGHVRVKEVRLVNAVFDENTGLFSAEVDAESYGMDGNLDLHFYANDQYGPRFLKTERFAFNGQGVEYSKELSWMKSLDVDQEIFVIAGRSDSWGDETIPPVFDDSKGLEVQLIK